MQTRSSAVCTAQASYIIAGTALCMLSLRQLALHVPPWLMWLALLLPCVAALPSPAPDAALSLLPLTCSSLETRVPVAMMRPIAVPAEPCTVVADALARPGWCSLLQILQSVVSGNSNEYRKHVHCALALTCATASGQRRPHQRLVQCGRPHGRSVGRTHAARRQARPTDSV